MPKSTGKIYEKLSLSFQWKIKKFASLSAEPGECYESPSFDFYDASWHLEMYPNGCCFDCYSYISVFLKKLNHTDSTHTVCRKISIKKSDGTDYASCQSEKEYCKNSSLAWGRHEFLKRCQLLEDIQHIAPDDILTISCTICLDRSFEETESEMISTKDDTKPQEPKIFWKTLVRNFKDSFLQKRNCDVIIKVKEQEFAVHRTILELRSTVFAAMFEHDMSENRNGVVEISDTEPDIFREFLLYLYCGEVEKLSSDNVYGLYALSHKYDAEDLKQECVEFMEHNLSVETVCDVLLLVEKYDAEELNELAKAFVLKNANAVLSGDQWAKLEMQSQELSNQILKSILLDKASKLK